MHESHQQSCLVHHVKWHQVTLELPGVPRVLCPACRLASDWYHLLLHRLSLASLCLPGLNRCRTRLSLHYTQSSRCCLPVNCHRLLSNCRCCSLAAASCCPLSCWGGCSWPCPGSSCSGSPEGALHSCPAGTRLCCCGSDTTRLSSIPGAASSLGCAHQASCCSIAASAPDRLHTAGLYSRAVSNCSDTAR